MFDIFINTGTIGAIMFVIGLIGLPMINNKHEKTIYLQVLLTSMSIIGIVIIFFSILFALLVGLGTSFGHIP